MNTDELIKNLAKLSQRERQVLGLVCAATSYEDIAKTLFISLPTVKAVMGRVYVKLGLDQLERAERMKAIYQLYCPLLKESAIPDEPMPPEKDEPVSEEIIKLVNEDAITVIPPAKSEVIYIPDTKPIDDGPSPIRIGIIVVLAIVLLIVGILVGGRLIPRSIPASNNVPLVIATEGAQPNSPQSLPTAAPIQQVPVVATNPPEPTTAPIVPTNPPEPTSAPLPTVVVPSISLPFSDNFDNGANPAWDILSGSWLTANGRYTISNADDKWAFSVLDDPSWTNYRIKVNVQLEKSDEGQVVVIVRYGGSKYLVFRVVQIWHEGAWAFYDGNSFTDIAGRGSIDIVTHQFDLEVDAIGNVFSAKINGMETQRISLSGYDKGGVGLGISCFFPGCSSFSDFQVSPAP